ncbi:amino acid permease [Salirhabdus sp. Marseille-P4669]|uniref:amino acid permease n=1 Tax=Salirhabdus sp. Marseille-P4669 TaxID=2042310 RepID=UPI000C7CA5B9|nr:amino acid permease [Salirhabdus sp. Marseille-P4669]
MSENQNNMKWWQLSLFGIGSTIGTGFFLASSLGIKIAGPSILIGLLFAGLATYTVFDALAKMTVKDPQKGAFRIYAQKAFGHWAGFSVGWAYWVCETLIMGSQLTALSIFTQLWFPKLPLWMLASGYAVLGLLVLLLGNKRLSKAENIFAVMKIAAILMFIIIGLTFVFGWMGDNVQVNTPSSIGDFFPNGLLGLWSSFIFAFYAFGGVEVMGLMAIELKDKKEAPKAGSFMVLLLVIIYVVSIGLALLLVNWDSFNTDKSTFVVVLNQFDLNVISNIFNGVLIIAGFSTMVASFFGVTTVLINLAEGKDAPAIFAKKGRLAIPLASLGLLIAGLITSIVMSLLLPDKIYEYITTGAGLMILYNWFFIILSATRNLQLKTFDYIKYYVGMALILLGVSGTLLDKSNRMGFFISLGFVFVIGVITIVMSRIWKKQGLRETN